MPYGKFTAKLAWRLQLVAIFAVYYDEESPINGKKESHLRLKRLIAEIIKRRNFVKTEKFTAKTVLGRYCAAQYIPSSYFDSAPDKKQTYCLDRSQLSLNEQTTSEPSKVESRKL